MCQKKIDQSQWPYRYYSYAFSLPSSIRGVRDYQELAYPTLNNDGLLVRRHVNWRGSQGRQSLPLILDPTLLLVQASEYSNHGHVIFMRRIF